MAGTRWLLPLLVLCLSACAALQPGDGAAARLQEEIRRGETLAAGEWWRITTRDGTHRLMQVGAVDAHHVRGQVEDGAAGEEETRSLAGADGYAVAIPVDDIIRIEAVQPGDGADAGQWDNVLFVAIIGVLMVLAAFANF